MGKVAKSVGGVFGIGKKKRSINAAEPVEAPKADPTLDPNQSQGVAAARRRRMQLARRSSRSSLRVDLKDQGTQTRGGLTIS